MNAETRRRRATARLGAGDCGAIWRRGCCYGRDVGCWCWRADWRLEVGVCDGVAVDGNGEEAEKRSDQ